MDGSSKERVSLNAWRHFMSESTGFSDQRKQRLPRGTEGKMQRQIPAVEGSYPHPGRAGSCRSPASRPCTRPSEQGPGIPTPPERTWWPHPQKSTVPEMKIYIFTKGPWGEFISSYRRKRGVRGKDWLGWSICATRSMWKYWETLCVSNFNFLCFFIRDYDIFQLLRVFHLCGKSMKHL